MATMIPYIDPAMIENEGERLFYSSLMELPDDYTVLYSYKFSVDNDQSSPATIYESDFIIVHPGLGYMAVEVKGGEYIYSGNQWLKFVGKGYVPSEKDPVIQASRAMYNILDGYKSAVRKKTFPLKICYGVCFPHSYKLSGDLPQELKKESVFLADDLENPERKIVEAFGGMAPNRCSEDTELLIKKVLAPSFKLFSDLESQMDAFEKKSRRILTEEQERIIAETEYDYRKIFLGGAGTGKTFVAIEKTRRLVASGKRVLLTCFNRNLGFYFKNVLADEMDTGLLSTTNFHDFLVVTLEENGIAVNVPEDKEERSVFFAKTLPEMAFDMFAGLPKEKKYDALIVDEGQDFQEDWFPVLESLLKEGEAGELYIFADLYQSLFNPDAGFLHKLPHSKQRLVRNLRNTASINNWLADLLPPEARTTSLQHKGMPVTFCSWETPEEEVRLVEKETGRLVSQGIQPRRIVILSPHKKENSSFANREKIKEWPLGEYDDRRPNSVRFCTIRSFKGLEAEIVFLTGVSTGSRACTIPDIYVGSSRGRFLLYVFHQAGYTFK